MTAAEPLTIAAAAPLIRSGALTPSELLEQCLRRIDVYEPAVKAWAYLDRERVRRDADRLTAEAKAGHWRGPLHGIPVGVKDIIDVFDMPTGCGSKLWANSYARRDATVVERLRQAGAVILGKTVTTPFAYLDPPPTRNPWDLSRTPGGSSSGSAAAVACGMCLAALGTQTGGSLIRPASYCGVCSLKPTYGRVSVDGVLPLAPSLDHVGVMANCVRDLGTVFEAVAGADPRHPPTMTRIVPNTSASLDDYGGDGPQHSALDSTHEFFQLYAEPGVTEAFGAFLDVMRSGRPVWGRTASVGPVVLPTAFDDVVPHHLVVMATEAAGVHADRISRHPDDYGVRIRELIDRGLSCRAVEYAAALARRQQLIEQLRSRFRFLLVPATPGPPPPADTTGSALFNSPWSFTGLPTVSFPVGRVTGGLPVSAQLVSKHGWEDEALRVADWCEAVAGFEHRLPPVPG